MAGQNLSGLLVRYAAVDDQKFVVFTERRKTAQSIFHFYRYRARHFSNNLKFLSNINFSTNVLYRFDQQFIDKFLFFFRDVFLTIIVVRYYTLQRRPVRITGGMVACFVRKWNKVFRTCKRFVGKLNLFGFILRP